MTGTTAKPNTPLTIQVRTSIGTYLTNIKLDNAVSDGSKAFDWDQSLDPSPLTLDGSDDASASVFTPRFDTFTRYSGHLPSFVVRAGSAQATILDEPGHTVTLTLRSAGGAVRGTLTRTLAWPEATGSFTKNGTPVVPQPGDRVSTSSVPGKELVVLADDLAVTAADRGSMAATCFPNSQWVAQLMEGTRVKDVEGVTLTGGDGSVAADPLTQHLSAGQRIPKGWRLVLSCERSPEGFIQEMARTFK